jgi:uncharacterized protein (DUF362 family)
MKIHPLLDDPSAVVISRTEVSEPVVWEDYRRAAWQIMAAMQVELAGEDVVIKPNVTVGEEYANPDSGITTHPGFVHGLIDHALAHDARQGGITLVEDPRNTDDDEPRHWRDTGYPVVRDRTGVALRAPTRDTCVTRAVPDPHCHAELNVSALAVAPNTALINVPKMKTHNLGITTLCLKNLMGLVHVLDRHFCGQAKRELPEAQTFKGQPKREWMDRPMHERWQAGLARRLIDLAQVVKPDLNVVEGVVAREGTGFNRGRNRALGLCVAGVNMVAVDSVTSYLMGFDPQALVYLRMAADAGLGTNDLSQLRIYQVEDGAIVPCRDLEAFQAHPPLKVISDIKGEDVTFD